MADPEADAPATPEVTGAVEQALRERLAPFGFEYAEIRPERDHDGDPILLVESHYRLSERPVDSRETYAAAHEARQAARERGERRFLHIRHLFHEDQKVAS